MKAESVLSKPLGGCAEKNWLLVKKSLNNGCLGFIASKLSEYIGGGDAEGEQRAGTHTEGITVCLFLAFLFTCIPVSSEVCVCRKIEGAGKIMERDQF